MMKLGIVVIYLVSEENGPLLDLHLRQIAKNTSVPYTIYASVNRLQPRFRSILEKHHHIKICECPTTELRGRDEHSYYMEILVRAAVEDGVSHIAIFHVDSFPVSKSWFEELSGQLSDKCVLATAARKECLARYTTCLFFHRDFYIKHRPVFLLSDEELASSKYRRFGREVPHIKDSGFGYVFKAYAEGLSWRPLFGNGQPGAGCIHGDLVFHLEGATIHKRLPEQKGLRLDMRNIPFLIIIKQVMKKIIPNRFLHNRKNRIGKYLLGLNSSLIYSPLYSQAITELLKDPETYLKRLRAVSSKD